MNQAVKSAASAPRVGPPPVAFVRATSLRPFLDCLDEAGAPTQRLLEQARLPLQQLYDPAGFITLHGGYRFLELAVKREGIELAAVAAARTSAFSLGRFGELLQQSASVYDYLRTGSRLVNRLENRGATMWLTQAEDTLTVNQVMTGGTGLGPAIADSYTLLLTIHMLQGMLGPDWFPEEVGLRRGTDTLLGGWARGVNGRVLTGRPYSSITVPRSLLSRPVRAPAARPSRCKGEPPHEAQTLPDSFLVSIELLIDMLAQEGQGRIQVVAEAAGMSARGLQRRLVEAGTSFTQLLTAYRVRRASRWLESSALTVAEIAAELGYTDASNFARAFRRETGLSPAAFRKARAQTGPDAGTRRAIAGACGK
jgi:AraC-like DNA-binding protein